MNGASGGKRRLHWLDLAVLAGVAAFAVYIAYRVDTVLVYKWDWSVIPAYLVRWDDEESRWVTNLLVQGFLTTIRLAFWGTILAALIGLVMGLCRVADSLFLRMVSRLYVELIRNLPPLVFIFVFYFFISSQIMPLLGIEEWIYSASPGTLEVVSVLFGDPKLLVNFTSGLICLCMFEGAYLTEIVRAGIQSIPRGQWEAGTSVGLSRYQLMRYVIMPQAIQRIVPPLANQFITLIKDSAIVSLISIQELTFMAIEVGTSTMRVFEIWITVAGMYFAICFGISLVFRKMEARMGRHRA
ncbi:MAG: amino acid ABC transporter permease [Rhodospirillales bacterium]|nr:amino acid ABC transporter permease [Rhodospirillales bacterium]